MMDIPTPIKGALYSDIRSPYCGTRSPTIRRRRAKRAGGFPRRVFAGLFLLILLILAPFADHHSTTPVWYTYSTTYLVILGALLVGGAAAAAIIAWSVRGVRPGRRAMVGLTMVAVPVAAVLLAEWWVGYRNHDAFSWYRRWGHTRSAFVGYEAAPNNQWTIAGATYSTDGDTFRTHTTARVPREQETLIVLTGGSAVFGYGLNDDETWAVRLEARLRERFGPSITVINAGCNGHNTLQAFFRAYIRVMPLKPDFLIYYGAINDVRTDARIDELIPFPDALVHARSVRDYLRIKYEGQGFYLENSLLLCRIGESLGLIGSDATLRHRTGREEVSIDDFRGTTALYLRNLDSLRLLSEHNGTTFVPVTFLAEVERLPEPYRTGLAQYVNALRDDCRRRALPLIDLIPSLAKLDDKTHLFFKDHYHPNRNGSSFLADRVADALTPMLQQHLVTVARNGRIPRTDEPSFANATGANGPAADAASQLLAERYQRRANRNTTVDKATITKPRTTK